MHASDIMYARRDDGTHILRFRSATFGGGDLLCLGSALLEEPFN